MYSKTQGEDIAVILKVKDSEGSPMPINALVDYNVIIYTEAITGVTSRKVVFKKTPQQGEYQAINHNNNNGELLCIIPRSITDNLPVGNYNLQLSVKVSANSNYENSQATSIEKVAKAFILKSKVL
jgi:hypothetical protein